MIRSFMAFENTNDSFTIEEMKIINDLEHVTLEGILKIEKNASGMQKALVLKRVVDATIHYLKTNKLRDEE